MYPPGISVIITFGYYESKGILIDPRTGIYSITNSYGGERIKIYNPYLIKHTTQF